MTTIVDTAPEAAAETAESPKALTPRWIRPT